MTKQLADDFGEVPMPVLSGASGVEPITSEERSFLEGLTRAGLVSAVRAYGSRLGHAVEAHFPLGVALAALALHHGEFYPPFDSGVESSFDGAPERILVTGLGHWRGEGLALLERAV
jgi:3-oxoacyl-[acyl-carrier-protein] synthase II